MIPAMIRIQQTMGDVRKRIFFGTRRDTEESRSYTEKSEIMKYGELAGLVIGEVGLV